MTLQATFAATLVDELVRGGVRHAVVAPGSRSGPLALALEAHEGLQLHVRLDERSAAFFALGTALGSGAPAVMLTTSGTAAAEVHAAVVEADLARVPLIVLTADRPPELHQIGAPQTAEQVGLFGRAVRFASDLGVPDATSRKAWRSVAARLVAEATASVAGPGPVHANVALREPLAGAPDDLPEGAPAGAAWHTVRRGPGVPDGVLDALLAHIDGRRGVIIAGGGAAAAPGDALFAFSDALGWPVLAEPRACAREPRPGLIAHGDGIARSPVAREHLRPEVVLRVGAPHASKVLAGWCGSLGDEGVEELLVDPYGSFEDPERHAREVLRADPSELLRRAANARPAPAAADWRGQWEHADRIVEGSIAAVLAESGRSEPAIARELFAALPAGATLVCSSSMPVRDVEWFAAARVGAPRVLANRGANGIDGVTSTVLGVAASVSAGPVVGLTGDLAFLHDVSALVWGRHEERPAAVLVVVDNGGGGIFDFLDYPGTVEAARYERLFGTPQAVDVGSVAAGFGVPVLEGDAVALGALVEEAIAKTTLCVVRCRTDRQQNVAIHARLTDAIVGALDRELT